MSTRDFLVEIGTEELPPKSLFNLSNAFTSGVEAGLKEAGLIFGEVTSFASPRRLALRVQALQDQQPEKAIEKKGPALKAAYDNDGNPSKALMGFSRSLGIEPNQLTEMETPKGTWLVYRSVEPGKQTVSLLNGIVNESLAKLPIAKRMRWGDKKDEFVRPVQWILMLFGNDVVAGTVLGIKSGNTTRGHRFHSQGEITITDPNHYEIQLRDNGKVIADYQARKELVRASVKEIATTVGGQAVIDENLLDEVCSLNEWPIPLIGRFDDRFLEVPAEALISSMKEHQKYFHVVDEKGQIMPHFITLSNIESSDSAQVISGNERVIRPRLSDAAFFYETDKKQNLAERRNALKSIVFQNKLGSIYDKTERVSKLAAKIAHDIDGEPELALRAGQLAKSDLVTEMVLEFTDLQGIMGYYYAQHDGEHQDVAIALNEQYMPKQAGGELPSTATGTALALAEKLDSLVGLFGINQPPTGTKDPFALRRAALGVLRIIVDKKLNLDLTDCIQWAINEHQDLENEEVKTQLLDYMLDRFRAWYEDEDISAEVFLSVSARKPTRPLDFDNRVKAVNAFYKLDEAKALSAANKRVTNILAKQNLDISNKELNENLLEADAEKNLAQALHTQHQQVTPLFAAGKYEEALASLASLQQTVDTFFDDVMVMVDDDAVKTNRLVLLSNLRDLFLQVADISLLSK